MKRVVEIVCCSAQDCVAAEQAGGGRIELCSAIELGGLTPSVGLIREACKAATVPIMAMIRPRPGGFCYSASEFQTMIGDCEVLDGPNGFVFGILNSDRTVDKERCNQIVKAAGRLEKVFHRAFDQVPNPFEALETLINLGFTRILTSGLAPTAAEGADMIKRLIDKADGRIEIMPGGGVRTSNVAEILATGCKSVHLAPRRSAADGAMEVDRAEVSAVSGIC